MTDICEHAWRRYRVDPLDRYYGLTCVRCGHQGMITYDKRAPEPTVAEHRALTAILAAKPAPPPIPRPVRFRRWRTSVRCRLASIVAGFDV